MTHSPRGKNYALAARWAPAILLAVFLAVAPSVPAQRQRALVIGNAEYTVSPLENPVNDATDMAAALERLGYEVTLGVNLGSRELVGLVQGFQASIDANDSVVFYFAGHGIQLGGQNFLIPVDADLRSERDLESQTVQVSRIARAIEEMGVTQSLLILDACRDNPFLSQSRGGTRGLSLVSARTGSMVVYATAPGQVAFDGDGRNGLFTSALLRHIETPGIEVHDMVREVRADVASETENRQIPFATSSITEPMYLASLERSDRAAALSSDTVNVTIDAQVSGAELYLDGALVGTTPFAGEVPVGSYTLRLRHPDVKGVTRILQAVPGEPVSLRIDGLSPSLSEQLEPLVTRQGLLVDQYAAARARNEMLRDVSMVSFQTALAGSFLTGGLAFATFGGYWVYERIATSPGDYFGWNNDISQLRADVSGSVEMLRYATYAAAGVTVSAAITSLVTWLLTDSVDAAVAAEYEATDAEINRLTGEE
ncbi:MAG: caspase family protein [Spirochaetota bacterium]